MQDASVSSGTEQGEERALAPPYISFPTFFKTLLPWLESQGVPIRFDRSFWQQKFSGSTGPQLVSALRFLGLLKGDVPQPDLDQLVKARGAERKALLKELIRKRYAAVNFEQLPRATPTVVTDWLKTYPVEGDTLRKVESFFINACKEAEIELPSGVRKRARMRVSRPATASRGEKRAPKDRASLSDAQKGESKPPGGSSAITKLGGTAVQDSLLLLGLFTRLPKPGSIWPQTERDAWIEAAKTVFRLEYKGEAK